MCHNTHLRRLAKEPQVRLHPSEGSKRQLQTGDKVTLSRNGNFINATVALDARLAMGTVFLPIGFNELNIYELNPNLLNGVPITIAKQH